MNDTSTELPSFGGSLAASFLALGIVCVLAFVGLRFWGRRTGGSQGAMRIVSRLGLEARRSVVVVDVAGRGFLLGSCDAGVTLLAELDQATLARLGSRTKPTDVGEPEVGTPTGEGK